MLPMSQIVRSASSSVLRHVRHVSSRPSEGPAPSWLPLSTSCPIYSLKLTGLGGSVNVFAFNMQTRRFSVAGQNMSANSGLMDAQKGANETNGDRQGRSDSSLQAPSRGTDALASLEAYRAKSVTRTAKPVAEELLPTVKRHDIVRPHEPGRLKIFPRQFLHDKKKSKHLKQLRFCMTDVAGFQQCGGAPLPLKPPSRWKNVLRKSIVRFIPGD